MRSRVVQNLLVLGIAALVLLIVYSRALNGSMLMDDDNLIYDSSVMHGPHAIERMWLDVRATSDYYPLTHMSWWLDFRIAELFNVPDHVNAIIHVENVLLHAASCMLAWIIARRLGINAWGAALAAGIFALHPVQVESVAWMSQRKNVLSGLFYLLSAYGFVRGVMETKYLNGKWYGFALGMFACALFAKPRVMTLAGSVMALAWWKGGDLWKRRAMMALPMFAMALPMAVWTMHVQKTHVGTGMNIFHHTLAERCVIAGKVLLFSLGKLMWPADFSFAYHRWNIDANVLANWLQAIACIVLLITAWITMRRVGRGVFATLAHIVISLSPSLGFISIFWHRYYWTADHEQYLNVIGFGLLVGSALGAGMERRAIVKSRSTHVPEMQEGIKGEALQTEKTHSQRATNISTRRMRRANAHQRREGATTKQSSNLPKEEKARFPAGAIEGWRRSAGWVMVSLLLLAGAALSWRQARLYNNAIELWEAVRAEDPASIIANRSLGLCYRDTGQFHLALERAMTAINAGDDASDAYVNLAAALSGLGRQQESMAAARKAIELHEHGREDQKSPRPARAYFNYGSALMNLGRPDEAIQALRRAAMIEPSMSEAWYNLGNSYRKMKRLDEALAAFENAVKARPGFAEAWVNMGITLKELGRVDEARRALEEGLRFAKPGSEAERIGKEHLGKT